MLHDIPAHTLNLAVQAGRWIQGQIAVAKTSQYGIVRFLANHATPKIFRRTKLCTITAFGVKAAFCFGMAIKEYRNYCNRFPRLSAGDMIRFAGEAEAKPYDPQDIETRNRIISNFANVHKGEREKAIAWAFAGVAFAVAAIAVAILMPTP